MENGLRRFLSSVTYSAANLIYPIQCIKILSPDTHLHLCLVKLSKYQFVQRTKKCKEMYKKGHTVIDKFIMK